MWEQATRNREEGRTASFNNMLIMPTKAFHACSSTTLWSQLWLCSHNSPKTAFIASNSRKPSSCG